MGKEDTTYLQQAVPSGCILTRTLTPFLLRLTLSYSILHYAGSLASTYTPLAKAPRT